MKVECVWQGESIIGESPIWSKEENLLYWVDIAGKMLHTLAPATSDHKTFHFPEIVTAVSLRKKGGLVLTLRKQIVNFDPQSQKITPLTEVEKDLPENRFNDAKCDRFGRLWAGTMNGTQWKAPNGTLYCLHPNGEIFPMLKQAICLNGLGWSPDNRIMYVTESFRYAIFAYDFDPLSGALSHKRIFASVAENSGGFPDGLTVDAEGFIWSAQTGLGRVVRYHPSGTIDRTIEFPVPRTTSCIFGGPRLETLYVTSARETMSDEEIKKYPLSGSLFACQTGLKGLAEPSFG